MPDLIEGVPNGLLVIGGTVLLMWFLLVWDKVHGGHVQLKYAIYSMGQQKEHEIELSEFGPTVVIKPVNSLVAFFTAPLFHVDLGHILVNTLPFVVSAWFVIAGGVHIFFIVTPIVVLITGLGIKLFSPKDSRTVGMSGVNLGYFGYVLSVGFLSRNYPLMVIGGFLLALTIIFYEKPIINKRSVILSNIWPTSPEITRE